MAFLCLLCFVSLSLSLFQPSDREVSTIIPALNFSIPIARLAPLWAFMRTRDAAHLHALDRTPPHLNALWQVRACVRGFMLCVFRTEIQISDSCSGNQNSKSECIISAVIRVECSIIIFNGTDV